MVLVKVPVAFSELHGAYVCGEMTEKAFSGMPSKFVLLAFVGMEVTTNCSFGDLITPRSSFLLEFSNGDPWGMLCLLAMRGGKINMDLLPGKFIAVAVAFNFKYCPNDRYGHFQASSYSILLEPFPDL